MNKKLSLLFLMAIVAMTASAYTYYNNIEIGNFKYSYLALGSSSSEENYAFMSGLSSTASTSLTTLDIPGYVVYNGNNYRVKKINQDAFHNNTKITNVTFGYGVEYISSYVFDGCTNLKTVNLPSSVKEIGQFVFQNCSSLMIVAFAGDVAPKIYDYTFNLSNSTKRASTATYRGRDALRADSKWEAAFGYININKNYGYTVGDFKVYNSTHGCWQYYTIKNGIPYNSNSSNPSVRSMCVLVSATFTDDTDYTVTLPQSVGNYDNNAPGTYKFYGVADSAFLNNTAITDIYDSNTLAYKIGNYAFYGCSNLTYANVPVDTIGYHAFENCPKLVNVELYNSNLGTGVRVFDDYAFSVTGLKGAVIPKTTTTIGAGVFCRTASMTYIAVDGESQYFSSWKNALYNKDKTELYQIPGKWTNDGDMENFAETLKIVRTNAAEMSNLTKLYLPYGVEKLYASSFRYCRSLVEVHLPSSVTFIHDNSFRGDTAVKRVYLNLMTPPDFDHFQDVPNKSAVALYTPYEAYSAYGSSSIWSQYNRKTGTYDHTNCWDIKTSNGVCYTVLTTSPYSYYSHTSDGTVKIVRIPGSVSLPMTISHGFKTFTSTEIGYRAAINPSITTSFYQVSGGIIKIHDYAFADSKLENFRFNDVEYIGQGAFQNTTSLVVDLNLIRLKTIGNRAFFNSGITKFSTNTTLTTIGNYAFYNCSNLHEIFLPHIDGKNPITCGLSFFGGSLASDFKCWVDYRQLGDFVNSSMWDGSKIYPHLRFDYGGTNEDEWMAIACVKPLSFEGTGVDAYTMTNFDQNTKRAILEPITSVAANNGALVHGKGGTYYRLNYASSGTTCIWLQPVTSSSVTVASDNTTSYYLFGNLRPDFIIARHETTITRGHSYLKLGNNVCGAEYHIYTNLSAITGDVNCDGSVNAADVTALYNYILNGDTTYLDTSDVNNDDAVNAGDVTAVYNIILGQN